MKGDSKRRPFTPLFFEKSLRCLTMGTPGADEYLNVWSRVSGSDTGSGEEQEESRTQPPDEPLQEPLLWTNTMLC